jgi:hypothetical protein
MINENVQAERPPLRRGPAYGTIDDGRNMDLRSMRGSVDFIVHYCAENETLAFHRAIYSWVKNRRE